MPDPDDTVPQHSSTPSTSPWTDDPAEIAALDALHALVAGWVEALYAVPDARYVNPAGGHHVEP